MKNDCRDWRDDQSRTAACAEFRQHGVLAEEDGAGVDREPDGSNEGDEIDLQESPA